MVSIYNMQTIKFDDLFAEKDLSCEFEKAFGYDGLGIILVCGIPLYEESRKQLLPLGFKLAHLPRNELAKLEHAQSNYSVGWSHGKEKIGGGKADIYKGSFYANPIKDVHTLDEDLIAKYPDTLSANIWPCDSLPTFEESFKKLGKIIVETGRLVGKQCDKYIHSKFPLSQQYTSSIIEKAVSADSPKSRLLHYFPINESCESEFDDWCKWHKDHGALTGLTRAMYFDEISGNEIPNPDPKCGLWVRTLTGDIKIDIPEDCLAFQIGETSQIMSGGLFRATTHCVSPVKAPGIVRCTFATFMQPDSATSIDPYPCFPGNETGVERYTSPMTFGEFSRITINQNY